jgi:superfamily II DNA or RNA helicase
VVDEFHHAAADSYDRLLTHLRPNELLDLTATPERLDGRDVTDWFDHRIAVELRLWEAIDQGFLVPFQYFGVADGTDLRQLTWRRGGYAAEELNTLFTGDDVRVAKLLEAIRRIVLDPGRMRALGFCVSKEHARYMARKFTEAGLESIALTGDDSLDVRDRGLTDLKAGRVRCVFSVEVLGEGVDVPDVDCVLLLRPTESATLFTQQLGRGLRRARDKSSLTVIDLIGQQRQAFRFEDRLRAILDARRGKIVDQSFSPSSSRNTTTGSKTSTRATGPGQTSSATPLIPRRLRRMPTSSVVEVRCRPPPIHAKRPERTSSTIVGNRVLSPRPQTNRGRTTTVSNPSRFASSTS